MMKPLAGWFTRSGFGVALQGRVPLPLTMAARFMHAFARFSLEVVTGNLIPDTGAQGEKLCTTAVPRMFGCCQARPRPPPAHNTTVSTELRLVSPHMSRVIPEPGIGRVRKAP